MKKQVKLKATETAATNSDFYNLFRPIVPSIDIIGKVAQIVSGLTEAVTIWYITQSEMSGSSKSISILISILAMILVVAILELGGRKFLQVLTRAIVWKRLTNAWYISLFTIVAVITIGMGVLSFRLSTNGVHHAFVSNVPVAETFDASALKQEYRTSSDAISDRFANDLQVIKTNHDEVVASTRNQYDARIKTYELKADKYEQKYKEGNDWAKSHAEKYRKNAAAIETEKTAAITKLQSAFSNKIDAHQKRKNDAIDVEKATIAASIAKEESVMQVRHESKFKNAEFWGSLLSFFVGFSVMLAFVCIISVEVYRRGSGIKVEYEEEDHDQPIASIILEGIRSRFGGFFRRKAESFARVSSPSHAGVPGKIGFNYPDPMAIDQAGNDISMEADVE